LKGIVKDHAEQTQKRPNKFAEQCAVCEYEQIVLKFVYYDMVHQIGLHTYSSRKTIQRLEVGGQFSLRLSETNTKGVGVSPDIVKWRCNRRQRLKYPVSDLFIYAIRKYSHIHGLTKEFEVTGYTYLKTSCLPSKENVIYYANKNMGGKTRYDFALINFLTDEGKNISCPSKILGFLTYKKTQGVLTPLFATDQEMLLCQIQQQNAYDDSLYVVVHSASD
jgi:hypothetical protein